MSEDRNEREKQLDAPRLANFLSDEGMLPERVEIADSNHTV